MVNASSNGSAKPRVLVIALDGATYDLLEPWMEQGHLPNLKKLYDSGVHGPLESVWPPLTAPAWSSFMTGKNPANHGLMEFFTPNRQTYKQDLNSSKDIDGRTIWRILSDNGRSVGVLSIPMTWPPEKVNGVLVTGLMTPRSKDVTYTYPPELGKELETALGQYRVQHVENYVQNDPTRLINEELDIMNNKVDATLYLMKNKPWDFFMVHFFGSDILQHAFWHFIEPTHPHYKPEYMQKWGNPILNFYKALDQRLAEILAAIPPDTYILVISDHGFGPLKKYINFNTWLLKKGFIRLKGDLSTRLRYLMWRLGFNYKTAVKIAFKTGFIARWVINKGEGEQESLQRKVFLSLDDVDWPNTQAYSAGNYGQMYLNVKGRDAQGCINPADYDRALDRLEQELRTMRDPETGEPVIDQVWRKKDLFQGKYADQAPDLVFFTKGMLYKAMGLTDFATNAVFEELYGTEAHHHMNGVLMFSGPGIKAGTRVEGARLIDMAPTIFHLMNVPIPTDLDGRVLTEAFTPGKLEQAPQYESTSGDSGYQRQSVYSEQEEAELTEMLRNLGYVG